MVYINAPGIEETRSKYLPGSMISSHTGRNLTGVAGLLFLAFFAAILLLAFLGSPGKHGTPPVIANIGPYIRWTALIFGILFSIGAWFEYTLLQTIESIPTSKIGSAAEGLNEISCSFTPEDGTGYSTPLFNEKCVYCLTELQELHHSKNGTYWVTIAKHGYGVPALLTDGTGYLAVDLKEADMTALYETGRKHVLDKNGKNVLSHEQLGRSVYDCISNARGPCDLSKSGAIFGATGSWNLDIFGGGEISVLESTIPLDTAYFAMGRIAGLSTNFKGKPLKVLAYDKSSRILSIRNTSKGRLEYTDKMDFYGAFALGAILFLWGASSIFL